MDASEDTYDGLQPTGLMGRDRTPRLSRSVQLVDALQNRKSLVRYFVTAWSALHLPLGREILAIPVAKGHWVIPRTARSAVRERFVATNESVLSPEPRDLWPPRVSWWCVLALQKC
jgi:hypothetical protein